MKRNFLIWLSTVALAAPLQGQSFTNLDFEAANIVLVSNSLVATSDALPGWSAFSGTNQVSTVGYNYFGGGGPSPLFGLAGSNGWVINGNFSASFTPNGTISQTGLVPGNSESLLFEATSPSLLLSLGGQNLSYTTVSRYTNSDNGLRYNLYAADISNFAGQTETLAFSAAPSGFAMLDDIQFSPQAIPEPSAISLICLGSGVLFYVRQRKRSRL